MRYVRELTAAEYEDLERMEQQEIGRVSQRAQLILLSSRGYSVSQITDIQQVTAVTVYKWLDRFEADGPAGLYDKPRSGRPPKMDKTAMQQLDDAVSQSPTHFGYNFTTWTLPLLVSHLKHHLGLEVSLETVRQALKTLGYCWSRPRWAAPGADEAEQEAVQDQIEAVPREDLMFYTDETIVKRLPVIRAMWMRCGQQGRLPALRHNDKFALYGAFNPHTGETVHACFDRTVSDNTVSFLQHLMDAFPEQSITLIWDRASFHTSRIVTDWLADHPRLRVICLPPASPQMNPVEDLWRHLKQRVAANLNRSLDALEEACHRFFREHSPQDLQRMAGVSAA